VGTAADAIGSQQPVSSANPERLTRKEPTMTILAAANILAALAIVALAIAVSRKAGVSRDAAIAIAIAYGVVTAVGIASIVAAAVLTGGDLTVDRVFNVAALTGLLFLLLCTRSSLASDARG
jgi:hypothetical protein